MFTKKTILFKNFKLNVIRKHKITVRKTHFLIVLKKRLINVLFIVSCLLIGINLLYVCRQFGKDKNSSIGKLAPKFTDFQWCPNENQQIPINLNCHQLFSSDQDSIEIAKSWSSPCTYTDEMMMTLSSNCSKLKEQFKFWSEIYKVPNETLDYSLAFVIIGAKDAEQMVRLLQMIYNKQNVYCITYDNKTSHEFKQTLRNLDNCYTNIIMPEKYVDIHWAGYSILQTAMFCLKSLTETKISWKYVQIVSWNDFPLRTNEEFVKIMQIFNGAQDSLLDLNQMIRSRKYFNVEYSSDNLYHHLDPSKVDEVKNIPPGNLIEYKGSLATTMTREFVEFLFTNPIAQKLYEWLNTSYCAEEIFWSTLMHNLQINPPGGFPGACFANYWIRGESPTYLSRYQLWEYQNNCGGKLTQHSCVFGVSDLYQLKDRPEFMVHKIYLDFEPATFFCMAQLHFYKTFFPNQYSDLNISFYENYPRVRYHRMEDKEQFKC